MLREFLDLEGNLDKPEGVGAIREYPAETIEYKGRLVLYQQRESVGLFGRGVPFVLVLGYVASEPYAAKSGRTAVKVEPLKREDQQEVEKLLADRIKGPIDFLE